MKRRIVQQCLFIVVILIIVAGGLMTGLALGQTDRKEALNTASNPRPYDTVVQPPSDVFRGGRYQMSASAMPGSTTTKRYIASGGGYRLEAQPSLGLTGSGCCCTYLPVILR